MDCRCRKLSLSLRQFLSAVGVLEQDCRYIFSNFEAMSPVAKTPWKASSLNFQFILWQQVIYVVKVLDVLNERPCVI